MSNLNVDMQAYRLTEEQKTAMHRLFQDQPDAEDLLRMLGVIEDPEAVPARKTVSLKCAKHNEHKYRTPRGGKYICASCRKERNIRKKAEGKN